MTICSDCKAIHDHDSGLCVYLHVTDTPMPVKCKKTCELVAEFPQADYVIHSTPQCCLLG